jgi:gas vesicle protein
MAKNKKNDTSILLNLPTEEKEKFEENTDNMSGTLRGLVEAYNEMEGGYDIDNDIDEISVVILKTYRNAIRQNEQLIKGQLDKIDEELEKFEEKSQEERDDVLVEIDLDIDTNSL